MQSRVLRVCGSNLLWIESHNRSPSVERPGRGGEGRGGIHVLYVAIRDCFELVGRTARHGLNMIVVW